MSTATMPLRRTPSQPSAVSAASDFERIMTGIFMLAGQPPGKARHRQACRLRFNNTVDLNLFPDPAGNLVVVGASRSIDSSIEINHLLGLMQLNSHFHSPHHVAVGYLEQSRTIQVWSKFPMQRMKEKDVMRMLKTMANAIIHINAILQGEDHQG